MENETWRREATLDDALQHGLTEKEFTQVVEVLGRGINLVDLGICSALYSEHCSYKSTKSHLGTLPTKGPRVIQGPGENAGVIDIDDGDAVVFKVESHNHPTFIEPFQGAATGVGGILRDVFTMGARPLALMNSLRFGEPDFGRTKYLVRRAVAGIGSYGNCMGVPTVGGELFFHPAYNGNCLVNAFALGLVKTDEIFLGAASGVGNPVLYVGSKTGRDGIHGATMASEEFDDDSESKKPTVQVGDPFYEKLLLEACLEVMASGVVVGIQDMGAAGMTSSSFEMADRADTGVRLDLDKVPQREEGMTPYEIMLSESQERMLLVVEKGKEQVVIDIVNRWELDAVQIGEVTADGNVDLYWHGEQVSSLPAALLTSSVPVYDWPIAEPAGRTERLELSESDIPAPDNLSKTWSKLVGSLNVASRSPVFEQYDSTVRSNTVIHPGGDAAVIRIKRDDGKPEKGVAMTLDCNSRYCFLDPRLGAEHAVVEAFRNITAVGAEAIGVSDCLNFGNPEKPEGMWEIAEGIAGIGTAATELETPIVSGNVSLYNGTKGSPILPTPLIAMVGYIKDSSKCVPAHFQNDGDAILLLGATNSTDIGGSEYASFLGLEKGRPPVLDYELERRTSALVRDLIGEGLLESCHDLSAGGIGVALAESCLGVYQEIGASVEWVSAEDGRKDTAFFAESPARYLVSCSPANLAQVRSVVEARGIEVSATGLVGGTEISVDGVATLPLSEVSSQFRGGIAPLFQ